MSTAFECTWEGIPIHEGDPTKYDAYVNRDWNIYYSHTGQDNLQATTAVHLRTVLRGRAYDAARSLPHEELIAKDSAGTPTTQGMKVYLQALRDALESEKPLKTAEVFDDVFYNSKV
jgi:hypothetical protein